MTPTANWNLIQSSYARSLLFLLFIQKLLLFYAQRFKNGLMCGEPVGTNSMNNQLLKDNLIVIQYQDNDEQADATYLELF